MTARTSAKQPIPFKRPACPAESRPAAGSRLTIDEYLPNGDMIVSDGRDQFRVAGLTFVPA